MRKNLKYEGPEEYQEELILMVKEFWDVFYQEGIKYCIRGFQFTIDTGDSKNVVCCKPPRYGPREGYILKDLCGRLWRNGLLFEDDGPYGSLAILADKPNQEGVTLWREHIFRLCVSYR